MIESLLLVRRRWLVVLFLSILLPVMTKPAYADNVGLIFRGVAKTLFSAFEIPRSMLQDTTRVGFPFGLVTGVVGGSARTVFGTLSGAADIARGAAPYAKYAALAFL